MTMLPVMASQMARRSALHIKTHIRMIHTSFSEPTAPLMAVLDDYLSISEPHLQNVPPSKLKIDIFNSHMPQNTPQEQKSLVEKLKPYTVISSMRERTPFPASLLRQLPNLKLLLCTGTQFETFDMKAAKEMGIIVAAAPGQGRTDISANPGVPVPESIKKGGGHPTTQHAWALILALARNVAFDDAAMKAGLWQTGMTMGLTGKTLGVIGMGRLGSAVAHIGAIAFGMRIVCWSANLDQVKADKAATDHGLPTETEFGDKTFRAVSKDELFKTSDFVSLHYVLGERTKGVVDARALSVMKPNSFIVNTSRGGLIDQKALFDVARAGKIRGIALDVFEQEPLPQDNPWRSENWGRDGRSHVILTPHSGYLEEGLMNRWYAETAENVERYVAGKEILHRLV